MVVLGPGFNSLFRLADRLRDLGLRPQDPTLNRAPVTKGADERRGLSSLIQSNMHSLPELRFLPMFPLGSHPMVGRKMSF